MHQKLKQLFGEMIVYKNLKESNFFSSLSLPSFLRDWILKEFQDENGKVDTETVMQFIRTYIPKKSDWVEIKSKLINDGESVKILTKIYADIDIRSGKATFTLPEFGLSPKDTIIEDSVWRACGEKLSSGECWGVIELGYKPGFDFKNPGKIRLLNFEDFCPYEVDLDYYKAASKQFDVKDWIDVLLGAIDYNPEGFATKLDKNGELIKLSSSEILHAKLTLLTRLLPFVEKRLNIIELAPKGTGKSYLFSNLSRYGWLSSGGVMSRAKLFYDLNKKMPGLVFSHDYIALDEIQTIKFPDILEMRGALKGYMENGVFTVGNFKGTADSGIILLGNIDQDSMNINVDMFEDLPEMFHESALIDRFHGFIKGWEINRLTEDHKASNWALNTEYFTSILHLLRDDISYRKVVDSYIDIPERADTRDTEAVKRLATAYLKLLFPYVAKKSDLDPLLFKEYCLKPAVQMRQIIKKQLGIIDIEYRGKDNLVFRVNIDE